MPIDVRTARAARNRRLRSTLLAMVAMAASGAAPAAPDGAPAAVEVNVQRLPRIGSVSDRFQSYTIEMLEVIGGKFWKPYDAPSIVAQGSSPATASRADMYAYRPPIDLDNRRLRLMARALGPAYLRVSGTWANSVYFAGPGETVARPPAGFTGVLTAAQWRKVIDFAHAVDASLVTSFAISDGTRDGKGLWTPQQARRLLDYTRAIGGRIAAAEFMNEPSMAGIGGAPKGYSAADYARDAGIFAKFMRAEAPGTMILGPGSATETPGHGVFRRRCRAASRPKRCCRRGRPTSTPFPTIIMARRRSVARRCTCRRRGWRTRCPNNGWRVPGRPGNSTLRCATGSRLESRCG